MLRKFSYGWRRDMPDFRDHKLALSAARIAAAATSSDLRPLMPPIYDQGALGSCTGNGIARVMQFERMRQRFHNYTPSRLMIYYLERVIEGTVASDAGAEIRDGMKAINATGVCDEALWPYDVSKFADQPPQNCYDVAKFDAALKYDSVQQNVDVIRAVLTGNRPVVFGFTVYESFESDAVAQSGIVPMPGTDEGVEGGHCTVIAGHDDATQRFLVANSWGVGWGMAGYFTIPYDYLANPDLADDFWQVELVGRQPS